MSILTKNQELAASNFSSSTSIIAGAGSGKTRVLTEYYKRLVQLQDVPIQNILAFTFTEKAALEISDRLTKEEVLLPSQKIKSEISTIHSFCHQIIKRYSHLIDLHPEFVVMSETENSLWKDHLIIQNLLEKLSEKSEFISKWIQKLGFHRFKNMIFELLEFPHLDQIENKSDDKKLLQYISGLNKIWLDQKIEKARINFQDLEILAVEILKKNSEILNQFRKKYQYILVDEFQDTNPIQAELISLLYQPNQNHLFIVGDPKQSIYRFRNAKLSVFFTMSDFIKKQEGKQIQLRETFRIGPKICQIIDQIFSPLFSEDEKYQYQTMISEKKTLEEDYKILIMEDKKLSIDEKRKREAEWITQHISNQNLDINQLNKIAILFRTSGPMKIYQEALEKKKVPYQISKSNYLLEESNIIEFIHIFNLINESEEDISLIHLLKSPYIGIDDQKLYDLIQKDNFKWDMISLNEKWNDLRNQISNWKKLRDKIPTEKFIQKIIHDLEDFKIQYRLEEKNIDRIWRNQFLYFCQELCQSEENIRFSDFMNQLLKSRKNGKGIESFSSQSQKGVQLLTIHSSKGLEFEQVFLPQLYAPQNKGGSSPDFIYDDDLGFSIKEEEKTKIHGLKLKLNESDLFQKIKSQNQIQEREEAKRLLYVAMTRVQSKLYLFVEEPSKPDKIDIEKSSKWNDWIWKNLDLPNHRSITYLDESFDVKENLLKFDAQNDLFKEIDHQNLEIKSHPIYSVTEVEAYYRCQKEYELRYQKNIRALNKPSHRKLENSQIKAKDWGNLMHEIFEYLDLHSFQNQKTVIDQALTNQQISASKKIIKNRIEDILSDIKSHSYFNALFQLDYQHQTELSFLLDLEEFKINGTIDRLIIKPDEVIILDYKTEKLLDPKEKDIKLRHKIYQTQLGLYALAVKKILSPKNIKTILLFTDGPDYIEKEWNQEELEKIQEKLSQFHEIQSQKNNDFKYPQNTSQCERCEYFDLNYCGIKLM